MIPFNLRLIKSGALPYLLSVPADKVPASRKLPLLCFLHGYDEGPPTQIEPALTRHGPLRPTSASLAAAEFILVAPQMPARGDLWRIYADAVQEVVRQVQRDYEADLEMTYLTGFSFGGNGVFDLALKQPDFWAALWPVDPTRVPEEDPGLPVWLSSGEVSRGRERRFIERLDLERLEGGTPGDRVYEDQGLDHTGTATAAYQDERIYRWLLSHQLPLT